MARTPTAPAVRIRSILGQLLADPPLEESGWASGTLSDALLRLGCAFACLWQLVQIWAVLTVHSLGAPRPLALAVHLTVMVAAGWAAITLRWTGLAMGVAFAVMMGDYAIARSFNDVQTLATVWMNNFLQVVPGFLKSWRRGALLAGTWVVIGPTWIWLTHPEWGPDLPIGIVVTTLAMSVAARAALPYIRRFASGADRADRLAAEAQGATRLVQAASREAAEVARTLHDTVINTMGAIANGGAPVRDLRRVRERCRHDVEMLRPVLDGEIASERGLDLASLGAFGIDVRVVGLDDDQYEALRPDVPAEVERAVHGAVSEAVQNAAKHAHADEVTVDVHWSEGTLDVIVQDLGVGFDPELIRGRGMLGSLRGRAALGLQVSIDARPAEGTMVAIRWKRPVNSDLWAISAAEGLLTRSSWASAAGVVAVGVVIELANQKGALTPTYLTLALSALFALGAGWWTRTGRPLSPALIALGLLIVPCGFVAAFSVVLPHYGRSEAVLWQQLAVTPVLVMMAHGARTVWPAFVAALALIASAILVSVELEVQGRQEAALLVPVGVVTAVGALVAWLSYSRLVRSIAAHETRSRAAARAAADIAAAREAADLARIQWRTAVLKPSVALLIDIAEGLQDPASHEVRDRCATEEAHLRQLLQISPEAVHVGGWLASSLALAHRRGVGLTIRSGDVDVPSGIEAEAIGDLLHHLLQRAAAGDSINVGLFESRGKGRLLVTAPAGLAVRAVDGWRSPDTLLETVSTHVGQDLIEMEWVVEGAS